MRGRIGISCLEVTGTSIKSIFHASCNFIRGIPTCFRAYTYRSTNLSVLGVYNCLVPSLDGRNCMLSFTQPSFVVNNPYLATLAWWSSASYLLIRDFYTLWQCKYVCGVFYWCLSYSLMSLFRCAESSWRDCIDHYWCFVGYHTHVMLVYISWGERTKLHQINPIGPKVVSHLGNRNVLPITISSHH